MVINPSPHGSFMALGLPPEDSDVAAPPSHALQTPVVMVVAEVPHGIPQLQRVRGFTSG